MTGDTTVLEHYLRPLRPHLDAAGVTELVINRPGEFAIEREGSWTWHDAPELTQAWLHPLAIAAAAATAQDVSPERPICSTVLPSGERCQIVLPPAAEQVSFTVRKAAPVDFTVDDLIKGGLFDGFVEEALEVEDAVAGLRLAHDQGQWASFFEAAVRGRLNILVSGATGSGKTTFAKALVRLIPSEERIVTIEDTRELRLPHRNAVHLLYPKDGQGLAQVTAKDLVESALRMRPDRILLQELRDASAFHYLRTANTGHPGSITTLHADSAVLAFEQLSLMVKESDAGRDLARSDIRDLLHMLVDVVVQVRRNDGRFRVSEVWYEPDRQRALAG